MKYKLGDEVWLEPDVKGTISGILELPADTYMVRLENGDSVYAHESVLSTRPFYITSDKITHVGNLTVEDFIATFEENYN